MKWALALSLTLLASVAAGGLPPSPLDDLKLKLRGPRGLVGPVGPPGANGTDASDAVLDTGVVVPGGAVGSCIATTPASECADASCAGNLTAYAAAIGKSVCQAVAAGGCGEVGAAMTACQCLLFSSLTGSTAAWQVGTALGIPESDLCLCQARNAMPLLADGSSDTLLIAAPICGLVEVPRLAAARGGRSPAASASRSETEVAALVAAVAAGKAVAPAAAARLQADLGAKAGRGARP